MKYGSFWKSNENRLPLSLKNQDGVYK